MWQATDMQQAMVHVTLRMQQAVLRASLHLRLSPTRARVRLRTQTEAAIVLLAAGSAGARVARLRRAHACAQARRAAVDEEAWRKHAARAGAQRMRAALPRNWRARDAVGGVRR